MGGEYLPFVNHLSKEGIKVQFSCPYTHQQNGVPKRKHRNIVEMGLTLLAHSGLPLKYWFEAFSTTTVLINNLPSSVLGFVSPFEKLYKRKPNYNFFKVFGCSCFPYLRDYSKNKLDFHSSKCIFIGYCLSHKGYRCLHTSGKVFVSRNVVFNEMEFPYQQLFGSVQHKDASTDIDPSTAISNLFNRFSSHKLDSSSSALQLDLTRAVSNASTISPTGEIFPPVDNLPPNDNVDDTHSPLTSAASSSTDPIMTFPPASFHPMITISKNGIFQRKVFLSHCCLPSSFLTELEPRSVKVAMADTKWLSAMKDELAVVESRLTGKQSLSFATIAVAQPEALGDAGEQNPGIEKQNK
ncbi:hypothetical protein EZV62_003199 [Acer yangbiense]|uniref:Integrase catalytic domain-containing protein n=1 Tax=Acer yangbiense TaxID=1000413 RepID=A0A5C7IGZ4_9ROSI|nr:hypothetical protein EZV62_003199 [Acer yangbiense]